MQIYTNPNLTAEGLTRLAQIAASLEKIESNLTTTFSSISSIAAFDSVGNFEAPYFTPIKSGVNQAKEDTIQARSIVAEVTENIEEYVKGTQSSFFSNAGMIGAGFAHGFADVFEGMWDGLRATGARLLYGYGSPKFEEVMDDVAIDHTSQFFDGIYASLAQRGATLTPDSKAMVWAKGVGSLTAYVGIASAAGGGTFGMVVEATTSGFAGMGRGVENAMENGASYEEAYRAGVKEGAIEAATEVVMGKGLEKISQMRKAGKAGQKALQEQAENAAQDVVTKRMADAASDLKAGRDLSAEAVDALKQAAKGTGDNVDDLLKAVKGKGPDAISAAKKLEALGQKSGQEFIEQAKKDATKGIFSKEAQRVGRDAIKNAGEQVIQEGAEKVAKETVDSGMAKAKELLKNGNDLPAEAVDALKQAAKGTGDNVDDLLKAVKGKGPDAAKAARKLENLGNKAGQEFIEDAKKSAVDNAFAGRIKREGIRALDEKAGKKVGALYDLRNGTSKMDDGAEKILRKVDDTLHKTKVTGAIADFVENTATKVNTGKLFGNGVVQTAVSGGILLDRSMNMMAGNYIGPSTGNVPGSNGTPGTATPTDPTTPSDGTDGGTGNYPEGGGSYPSGGGGSYPSGGGGSYPSGGGNTTPGTDDPGDVTEPEPTTPNNNQNDNQDNGTIIYSGGNGGNYYSGEGADFETEGDNPDDIELLDIDEGMELDEDDKIITIPTTVKGTVSKTNRKSGSGATLPILGTLGVAAAAGIGAKVYLDNKANNENGEDEEYDEYSENDGITADEWSGDEYGTTDDDSYLMYDPSKIDELEQGTSEI